MRDQIKNAEYFEEFLKYINKETAHYQNIVNNPQDYPPKVVERSKFKVFYTKLRLFIGKYSSGVDLYTLKRDYLDLINDWCASFSPEYYTGNIRMVSLAVLFNLDDSYMLKIKALLAEHKKCNWINEWLINFLLNPDVPLNDIEGKLKFPKIYNELKEAVFAEENQTELFSEYVSNLWYKKNRSSGWYNSHKTTEYPAYAGYWCFEAAAVAKRLSLDDSSLENRKYYPYELAHFE